MRLLPPMGCSWAAAASGGFGLRAWGSGRAEPRGKTPLETHPSEMRQILNSLGTSGSEGAEFPVFKAALYSYF